MLPILISVSVTPVSYFFCAVAGRDAAVMTSPESPSVTASVLIRSLAQRFMRASSRRVFRKPRCRFAIRKTRSLCDEHSLRRRRDRTIAGVRADRKRRARQDDLSRDVLCGAAQSRKRPDARQALLVLRPFPLQKTGR